MELDQDIINWHKLLEGLNVVMYGHDGTFYWIEMPDGKRKHFITRGKLWVEMPDGKRKHFITRGKLWASLAVLRMNHPGIKLQPVGTLPAPKRKSK
jgi:hypothetical protein